MGEKILVRDKAYGTLDFCQPLAQVRHELEVYENLCTRNGWTELEIDCENYDDYSNYYIVGKRLETDKEYKKRLEQETRQRAQDVINQELKEAKELKEYQRLKKKYEKDEL